MTVVFAIAAYYAVFGRLTFQPKTFELDLIPFYCGGAVAGTHANPYRTEPLRSCEHAIVPLFRKGSPLVVPAPQPPYVLAGMSAVSRIPFPVLQPLWAILEVLAFVASVAILARLLPMSPWLVTAALGSTDLYSSFLLGQFAVFCVLGIALAARGVRTGDRISLAAGLALAALEPHVAAPVFLAVLVWGKARERLVALAAGLALVVLSLAVASPDVIAEYLRDVLTVHALAEVNNQDQLSATYVLHALGFSPAASVGLAKLQYLLVIAAGIAATGAIAKNLDRTFLIFAPPAFALFGGPFVHITQFCAAIPAALALATYTSSRRYFWAAWLLCVPWINFATMLTILPLATAAWAAIGRYGIGLNPRNTWLFAGAATLFEGALGFQIAQENFKYPPPYGRVTPSSFAEVSWKALIDQQQHTHVLLANLGKLPTELGLLIVLAGCCLPAIASARVRGRRSASAAATSSS